MRTASTQNGDNDDDDALHCDALGQPIGFYCRQHIRGVVLCVYSPQRWHRASRHPLWNAVPIVVSCDERTNKNFGLALFPRTLDAKLLGALRWPRLWAASGIRRVCATAPAVHCCRTLVGRGMLAAFRSDWFRVCHATIREPNDATIFAMALRVRNLSAVESVVATQLVKCVRESDSWCGLRFSHAT